MYNNLEVRIQILELEDLIVDVCRTIHNTSLTYMFCIIAKEVDSQDHQKTLED